MSFLSLQGVTKYFGKTLAVNHFDLEVERGELVSFLGPSGCGKTTTLRMIAGFEMPDSGHVLLDDQDISHRPANRRGVGMVFQSYALFPNLNVGDNIAFGLHVTRRPEGEIAERVREMLTLIHLEGYEDRYPYQLSGGQQQRVALARALANQPRVLLLDEPLSALDAKIRVELREEIRRIQRTLSITTIYVTHDQEEAFALSDRVVVMHDGKIEQVGRPAEIYNFPRTEFVASFVGQINLMPVEVADREGGLYRVAGQMVKSEPLDGKELAETPRLAVRPEQFALGHVEGDNHLEGTLRNLVFLGSVVRMRVDIGGVILVVDLLNDRKLALPAVGDAVELSFPEHASWVM